MKKHLCTLIVLLAATTFAFSQDSSQPSGSTQNVSKGSVNETQVVLTPVIFFDEHPINHNMHIAADSSYYYTINGGNASSGQINKFDFQGTLIQTYPILIDGRGLSYNESDGHLYASTYMGDIVRIDDLAAGTFTMLFPGAMQNGQASFAISDDGTLFYDFYAGTLRIHEFNLGTVINTITGLMSGAGNFGGDAAIAADSIYLYTWNSAIKTVYIYDQLGTLIQSFTISDGDNGHSISFANDLLFISRDGNYNISTWYGYDLSVLTGIASASFSNSALQVYPNPFSDELVVRSPEFGEKAEIKIFDMYGREIYTQKPLTGNWKLKTENWKNGIYFLEAIIDGKAEVKKIVNQ